MPDSDLPAVKKAQPLAHFAALLDEPAHADNPLRPACAELLSLCTEQQERLSRLVRILTVITISHVARTSRCMHSTTVSCAGWKKSPASLTAINKACMN